MFKLLQKMGQLFSYLQLKRDRYRLKKYKNNGMKIGKNVYIGEKVIFDFIYPYLIEIGDNCRITSGTIILSHDATIFRFLGVNRIAPVKILEGTFIGANVIILPGVTIGPNAMIAAGSVVNRDIGEGKIAAGNPARPYADYSELIDNYREMAQKGTVIRKKDIENGKISQNVIKKIVEKDGIAFIQGMPTSDPYYVNTDINELRQEIIKAYKAWNS